MITVVISPALLLPPTGNMKHDMKYSIFVEKPLSCVWRFSKKPLSMLTSGDVRTYEMEAEQGREELGRTRGKGTLRF